MPQTLSNKLRTLDPLGKDKALKVYEALNIIAGNNPDSNAQVVNKLFDDVLKNIKELRERNALVDVNATYSSAGDRVENFISTSDVITQYTVGMVIILSLSQANAGAVTLNINSLGAKSVKKYNHDGTTIDLEDGDFSVNKKYFVQYSGTDFVMLCESSVQEIKNLQSALDTHTQDTNKHTSTEEKAAWNAKSTVTKSETNGNINVDGTEVEVYKHPAGTNPHGTTKKDVGLENVDNVKQYSATNPPPYPVTSVNGKTGEVALKLSEISNDVNFQTKENVDQSIANESKKITGNLAGKTVTLESLSKENASKDFLSGATAPTTGTKGSVGQRYIDTATKETYICASDSGGSYTWNKLVNAEDGKTLYPVANPVYTTEEQEKLAGLNNYDDTAIQQAIEKKVDKVVGKGLSSNDYTTPEKEKLAGIKNATEFLVTVPAEGWSAEVPYTQTITVEGMVDKCFPFFDLQADAKTPETEKEIVKISEVNTQDGSIIVTAKKEKPLMSLNIRVWVTY